ncbi:DUF1289 domain-containing protein [Sphingomonas koreensis]|nr:DUF1289 domain-containing protein [Sphingomonas koreensis]
MKSPCVDVCRFDRGTGWCIGCGRTLAETRKWRKTPRPKLLALSVELPKRLAKLSDRSSRSSD